ncbi:ribonuclease Y [Candidatus Peregrinibacteria bacterium]|nr:MAG: ribonuclease Y [Candidatus Peregrinibacteria bacterium]
MPQSFFNDPASLLIVAAFLIFGIAAGYFFKREDLRKRQLELEAENEKKVREAEKKVHESEKRARDIEHEATSRSKDMIAEAKEEAVQIRQEVEKMEARIEQKEEDLSKKVQEVERQRLSLVDQEKEIVQEKDRLQEMIMEETVKIEKIAKLSQEEAEQRLYGIIEQKKEKLLVERMKRAEREIEEVADEKAREAIVQAIQKYASEVTSDTTQTVVQLESDEMKGRIIGREGRNINAFERCTGVDVIVDDTPGVVIITGFDLLRRFIAKKSLEKLLEDGRVHPARIEEVVQKTTKEIEKMIRDFGEKALEETGITGVAPEIVKILGRLRFRTSHGQNVLKHSIEVAFLAEELANQVGANAERAKMAALFHDLGKAVSHEIGGKHALISGEIGRKFGLDPLVINAMEAHHEDIEKLCPEAYIVQAADAISASRPGARRDTTELYVKRLKQQEEIVRSFSGVTKCYVMSAGRDMWVFVNPEEVTDLGAQKMSQDIAERLRNELTFPGEIKIIVFRETRAETIAR